MQQTEQFKLNQWQKDDRILMEDFNADNLKIENALASKLGRITRIFGVSSTGGRSQITASYTGVVDWAKWEIVYYTADMPQNAELRDSDMQLGINGANKAVYDIPEDSFMVVFFPRHDPARNVTGLLLCKKPVYFSFDAPYSEMISLSLSSAAEGSVPTPSTCFFGIS